MCEAHAYVLKQGKEELLMESVDVVKTEGDRIFVQNIFGDQGWIKGRIKEMQLVQHRIVLEQTDQEE